MNGRSAEAEPSVIGDVGADDPPAVRSWVVFDATGTLIEPAEAIAESYQRIAYGHGAAIAIDQIETRIRAAVRAGFHTDMLGMERPPTDDANERRRWRMIVEQVLPEVSESHRTMAFEQLWDHFSQPAAWRVPADVPMALQLLQANGLRAAIASNFDHRLERVVAGLPELAPIERIFISATIGWSKPDPRFYRGVAAALGDADRPPLGMIGDDRLHDQLGAAHAGWTSVLIDRRPDAAETAARTLAEALQQLLDQRGAPPIVTQPSRGAP
jgi:putative hydrolase of the HAD superfamily